MPNLVQFHFYSTDEIPYFKIELFITFGNIEIRRSSHERQFDGQRRHKYETEFVLKINLTT